MIDYFFDSAIWRQYRKYILAFWLLFILGLITPVLVFYGVSKGMLGPLPTFEQLENPETALATEIYSADSVLLGKYFSQNRSPVTYDELSPYLVEALIATEDIRFYDHSGIDFRSLSRAIFGVLTLDSRGGASTITQQLATNLFHERASGLARVKQKLKEQVVAVRLESRYTKEEIIQMYLNTVDFVNNAYGIKSAAKTYFNKLPSELDLEEAAVLVGMLKGPSMYNPRRFPERSKNRRNTVFAQMHRYKFINDSLYAMLTHPDCVIELDFKSADHSEGMAPYFREFLRLKLKDWADKEENRKIDGTKYNIYTDGLTVRVTLDSRMQAMAEASVNDYMPGLQEEFFEHWKNRDLWKDEVASGELERHIRNSEHYKLLKEDGLAKDSINKIFNKKVPMQVFSYNGPIDTVMSPIDSLKYYRMFLQTGLVVVDPFTGFVKAWVGGTNFEHFKYDHITSKRQIGSTFKPFIYATAIDNGYSPCFKITDVPVTFEDFNNWTPENSEGEYTGDHLTLKQCLAESKNTCSAYLMKQIGPAEVIKLARRLGIESHIDPYPSICLGTPDISALEMAGSYTAFANKGLYTEPIYFTSILDKNGNEIASQVPISTEAMSEEKAYIMVEMLRNVVNHGTGRRLRYRYKFEADMCGKTGTTQNHSDGWFLGFTPELIAAVWTGGEDRVVRFRTIDKGQGAHLALPIWAGFFERLYADTTLGYFQDTKIEPPKGKLSVELDCSMYERQDDTGEDVEDYDSGVEYGGGFE